VLEIGYKSQGLNDWRYNFGGPISATGQGAGDVAQVRDFTLKMTTNFKDIDFPDNTLSPTNKTETSAGWTLDWNYKNLVSGYQIAMTMPEKLQPGPLAGRISFFAPVSLFFHRDLVREGVRRALEVAGNQLAPEFVGDRENRSLPIGKVTHPG